MQVVWDPNKTRVISAETHHHAVDFNIFEGQEVNIIDINNITINYYLHVILLYYMSAGARGGGLGDHRRQGGGGGGRAEGRGQGGRWPVDNSR